MGLFGHGGYYGMNEDMAIAPHASDGKLYRTVQLIAISVFLIAVVLVILEVFQVLKVGSSANGVILSIGVVGAGGMVALPWVRVLESFKDKRYKITAIAFMAVVGVCVILWIVCVWLIIGLINKGMGDGATDEVIKDALNSLNIIRASIIVSLQFIVASYIAKNIIKYNKTLLPYQVMAGASALYVDFYLALVLTAITITTEGIDFSKTAYLLTNMWVHALLAVFLVLAIFPNIVFRRTDRRNLIRANRSHNTFGADADNNAPTAPADNAGAGSSSQSSSVDEKLSKLKELLEKELITQEEYERKRADILNDL